MKRYRYTGRSGAVLLGVTGRVEGAKPQTGALTVHPGDVIYTDGTHPTLTPEPKPEPKDEK